MKKRERLIQARALLYAKLTENAEYLSICNRETEEGTYVDGYSEAIDEEQHFINLLLDTIGR